MTARLKIQLKPQQRIFINGGLLRVDRKVTIELLNEVSFLLEDHIIEQGAATTPLRQLYFIAQSMLMEPKTRHMAHQIFDQTHRLLIAATDNQEIRDGLAEVRRLIEVDRHFDALKRLRSMFPLEEPMGRVVSGKVGAGG